MKHVMGGPAQYLHIGRTRAVQHSARTCRRRFSLGPPLACAYAQEGDQFGKRIDGQLTVLMTEEAQSLAVVMTIKMSVEGAKHDRVLPCG
jgi:hypothetical protein